VNYNIDLQKIADELDFDLEDVQMLVEVFLETTQESLDTLKTAIEQNNFENICRAAHSIKGSAANLTMTEIANIAKEIEDNAKESTVFDYLEKYHTLNNIILGIKQQ
jgi:HPt (histidine-containing phosphotransfer) domain-containing protein